MQKQGAIFCFSGLIYQEMLSSIVETIKKELTFLGVTSQIINAIFHITIEQMQNIMKYSADRRPIADKNYASSGICIIGYDDARQKYFVLSSNKMNIKDKPRIKDRIDKINQMNKSEIRALTREMLKSGKNLHTKGAGIGFMEMAKSSSEPLEFEFIEVNGDNIFEMKVYV